MTLKYSLLFLGFRPFLMEAEGVGSGGGSDAPAVTPPVSDPASVLFGEGQPGETPKVEGETGKAAEWKEYVNDDARTEEENAAAKAEHDKAKPAAPDPADTVPEDGKYTLTAPEGGELDTEMLDAVAPLLKSKGFTAKEAQALGDAVMKLQAGRAQAQAQAWQETVAGWADTAKKDKEIGGDRWDSTVASATRAIAKFGTPELKEYLQNTGGGNHPELIRVFAKIGAAISDDTPPAGGSEGSGRPADTAHLMFPSDAPAR